MPPSSRLLGADIRNFRPARRFHGALLSLAIAPLTRGNRPQVAFIVSKKVASKATERNALKRLLREAARPLLSKLPPLAIVVTLKSAAQRAPSAQLREEFTGVLREVMTVAMK